MASMDAFIYSSPWKGALGLYLEGLTPRQVTLIPTLPPSGLIPGKHVKANRKVNQSSNKQARLEQKATFPKANMNKGSKDTGIRSDLPSVPKLPTLDCVSGVLLL